MICDLIPSSQDPLIGVYFFHIEPTKKKFRNHLVWIIVLVLGVIGIIVGKYHAVDIDGDNFFQIIQYIMKGNKYMHSRYIRKVFGLDSCKRI